MKISITIVAAVLFSVIFVGCEKPPVGSPPTAAVSQEATTNPAPVTASTPVSVPTVVKEEFVGKVEVRKLSENLPRKPELVSFMEAEGKAVAGVKKLEGINIPKGSALIPAPVADSSTVKVELLKFVIPEPPVIDPNDELGQAAEKVIEPYVGGNTLMDDAVLLVALDKAGYRPARIEELMAVRSELTLKEGMVLVLGTHLTTSSGERCTFTIEYGYVLGTDILSYGEGMTKVGLRPVEYAGKKRNIILAAVKK